MPFSSTRKSLTDLNNDYMRLYLTLQEKFQQGKYLFAEALTLLSFFQLFQDLTHFARLAVAKTQTEFRTVFASVSSQSSSGRKIFKELVSLIDPPHGDGDDSDDDGY